MEMFPIIQEIVPEEPQSGWSTKALGCNVIALTRSGM